MINVNYTSISRLPIKTAIMLSPRAAITRTFQISEHFLGGDNACERFGSIMEQLYFLYREIS